MSTRPTLVVAISIWRADQRLDVYIWLAWILQEPFSEVKVNALNRWMLTAHNMQTYPDWSPWWRKWSWKNSRNDKHSQRPCRSVSNTVAAAIGRKKVCIKLAKWVVEEAPTRALTVLHRPTSGQLTSVSCGDACNRPFVQWRHAVYQNTLPVHSWIKLYLKIKVDWLGGLLNTLSGVIRKWSLGHGAPRPTTWGG